MCAKATPYMQHLRKKEKYFVDRLHDLLENDLYSILPQLRRGSQVIRPRRGLRTLVVSAVTGLITLAVESLGSYLCNKQEKWINDAVLAMREDNTAVQNTLQQYSNDFLMYGHYNVETLEKVIQTVNSLHQRQTQLEEVFAKTQSGHVDEVIDAISFNFDLHLYMKLVEEEHVNQYQLLEKASHDLLKGIEALGQGKLPRELVSNTLLRTMLKEVCSMIRKEFPDYELADTSILHYHDMKLVTFSIDRETHSLIISFPVFVKDFRQPPLKLYEVDTVAVPIPDRNNKADSYTKVRIQKPYLAAGDDYYIQLKMTELVMCKSIRHTYYCEELFVVKHKSRHSCASAIFYDLGPEEVVQKCQFDYTYNTTMPPTVLDGGRSLLLANFHGPRSLKCNSKNGGLPKPAPEHVYAVVDRSFLCDCQLDLEHHATILQQLSSCTDNHTAHFRVEFVPITILNDAALVHGLPTEQNALTAHILFKWWCSALLTLTEKLTGLQCAFTGIGLGHTYYTALRSYGRFLYHFSPATSECTPPASPFQPPAAPAGRREGVAVNRGLIMGPHVPTHIILHQIPEEKRQIDQVRKDSEEDSGILADDPPPADTAAAQVISEMKEVLGPEPSTSGNVEKSPTKLSRKNPIVKLIRL